MSQFITHLYNNIRVIDNDRRKNSLSRNSENTYRFEALKELNVMSI